MKEDGRPCFYYILSGRIRLSYVGRGGEERTILYAGPGSLMNVPSVVADDVKNTVVTCMEAAEVALFDAAILTDTRFAAEHPDLMINLVQSLCVHLVIHSQRLAEQALADSLSQVCRVVCELAERHGGSDPFRSGHDAAGTGAAAGHAPHHTDPHPVPPAGDERAGQVHPARTAHP